MNIKVTLNGYKKDSVKDLDISLLTSLKTSLGISNETFTLFNNTLEQLLVKLKTGIESPITDFILVNVKEPKLKVEDVTLRSGRTIIKKKGIHVQAIKQPSSKEYKINIYSNDISKLNTIARNITGKIIKNKFNLTYLVPNNFRLIEEHINTLSNVNDKIEDDVIEEIDYTFKYVNHVKPNKLSEHMYVLSCVFKLEYLREMYWLVNCPIVVNNKVIDRLLLENKCSLDKGQPILITEIGSLRNTKYGNKESITFTIPKIDDFILTTRIDGYHPMGSIVFTVDPSKPKTIGKLTEFPNFNLLEPYMSYVLENHDKLTTPYGNLFYIELLEDGLPSSIKLNISNQGNITSTANLPTDKLLRLGIHILKKQNKLSTEDRKKLDDKLKAYVEANKDSEALKKSNLSTYTGSEDRSKKPFKLKQGRLVNYNSELVKADGSPLTDENWVNIDEAWLVKYGKAKSIDAVDHFENEYPINFKQGNLPIVDRDYPSDPPVAPPDGIDFDKEDNKDQIDNNPIAPEQPQEPKYPEINLDNIDDPDSDGINDRIEKPILTTTDTRNENWNWDIVRSPYKVKGLRKGEYSKMEVEVYRGTIDSNDIVKFDIPPTDEVKDRTFNILNKLDNFKKDEKFYVRGKYIANFEKGPLSSVWSDKILLDPLAYKVDNKLSLRLLNDGILVNNKLTLEKLNNRYFTPYPVIEDIEIKVETLENDNYVTKHTFHTKELSYKVTSLHLEPNTEYRIVSNITLTSPQLESMNSNLISKEANVRTGLLDSPTFTDPIAKPTVYKVNPDPFEDYTWDIEVSPFVAQNGYPGLAERIEVDYVETVTGHSPNFNQAIRYNLDNGNNVNLKTLITTLREDRDVYIRVRYISNLSVYTYNSPWSDVLKVSIPKMGIDKVKVSVSKVNKNILVAPQVTFYPLNKDLVLTTPETELKYKLKVLIKRDLDVVKELILNDLDPITIPQDELRASTEHTCEFIVELENEYFKFREDRTKTATATFVTDESTALPGWDNNWSIDPAGVILDITQDTLPTHDFLFNVEPYVARNGFNGTYQGIEYIVFTKDHPEFGVNPNNIPDYNHVANATNKIDILQGLNNYTEHIKALNLTDTLVIYTRHKADWNGKIVYSNWASRELNLSQFKYGIDKFDIEVVDKFDDGVEVKPTIDLKGLNSRLLGNVTNKLTLSIVNGNTVIDTVSNTIDNITTYTIPNNLIVEDTNYTIKGELKLTNKLLPSNRKVSKKEKPFVRTNINADFTIAKPEVRPNVLGDFNDWFPNYNWNYKVSDTILQPSGRYKTLKYDLLVKVTDNTDIPAYTNDFVTNVLDTNKVFSILPNTVLEDNKVVQVAVRYRAIKHDDNEILSEWSDWNQISIPKVDVTEVSVSTEVDNVRKKVIIKPKAKISLINDYFRTTVPVPANDISYDLVIKGTDQTDVHVSMNSLENQEVDISTLKYAVPYTVEFVMVLNDPKIAALVNKELKAVSDSFTLVPENVELDPNWDIAPMAVIKPDHLPPTGFDLPVTDYQPLNGYPGVFDYLEYVINISEIPILTENPQTINLDRPLIMTKDKVVEIEKGLPGITQMDNFKVLTYWTRVRGKMHPDFNNPLNILTKWHRTIIDLKDYTYGIVEYNPTVEEVPEGVKIKFNSKFGDFNNLITKKYDEPEHWVKVKTKEDDREVKVFNIDFDAKELIIPGFILEDEKEYEFNIFINIYSFNLSTLPVEKTFRQHKLTYTRSRDQEHDGFELPIEDPILTYVNNQEPDYATWDGNLYYNGLVNKPNKVSTLHKVILEIKDDTTFRTHEFTPAELNSFGNNLINLFSKDKNYSLNKSYDVRIKYLIEHEGITNFTKYSQSVTIKPLSYELTFDVTINKTNKGLEVLHPHGLQGPNPVFGSDVNIEVTNLLVELHKKTDDTYNKTKEYIALDPNDVVLIPNSDLESNTEYKVIAKKSITGNVLTDNINTILEKEVIHTTEEIVDTDPKWTQYESSKLYYSKAAEVTEDENATQKAWLDRLIDQTDTGFRAYSWKDKAGIDFSIDDIRDIETVAYDNMLDWIRTKPVVETIDNGKVRHGLRYLSLQNAVYFIDHVIEYDINNMPNDPIVFSNITHMKLNRATLLLKEHKKKNDIYIIIPNSDKVFRFVTSMLPTYQIEQKGYGNDFLDELKYNGNAIVRSPVPYVTLERDFTPVNDVNDPKLSLHNIKTIINNNKFILENKNVTELIEPPYIKLGKPTHPDKYFGHVYVSEYKGTGKFANLPYEIEYNYCGEAQAFGPGSRSDYLEGGDKFVPYNYGEGNILTCFIRFVVEDPETNDRVYSDISNILFIPSATVNHTLEEPSYRIDTDTNEYVFTIPAMQIDCDALEDLTPRPELKTTRIAINNYDTGETKEYPGDVKELRISVNDIKPGRNGIRFEYNLNNNRERNLWTTDTKYLMFDGPVPKPTRPIIATGERDDSGTYIGQIYFKNVTELPDGFWMVRNTYKYSNVPFDPKTEGTLLPVFENYGIMPDDVGTRLPLNSEIYLAAKYMFGNEGDWENKPESEWSDVIHFRTPDLKHNDVTNPVIDYTTDGEVILYVTPVIMEIEGRGVEAERVGPNARYTNIPVICIVRDGDSGLYIERHDTPGEKFIIKNDRLRIGGTYTIELSYSHGIHYVPGSDHQGTTTIIKSVKIEQTGIVTPTISMDVDPNDNFPIFKGSSYTVRGINEQHGYSTWKITDLSSSETIASMLNTTEHLTLYKPNVFFDPNKSYMITLQYLSNNYESKIATLTFNGFPLEPENPLTFRFEPSENKLPKFVLSPFKVKGQPTVFLKKVTYTIKCVDRLIEEQFPFAEPAKTYTITSFEDKANGELEEIMPLQDFIDIYQSSHLSAPLYIEAIAELSTGKSITLPPVTYINNIKPEVGYIGITGLGTGDPTINIFSNHDRGAIFLKPTATVISIFKGSEELVKETFNGFVKTKKVKELLPTIDHDTTYAVRIEIRTPVTNYSLMQAEFKINGTQIEPLTLRTLRSEAANEKSILMLFGLSPLTIQYPQPDVEYKMTRMLLKIIEVESGDIIYNGMVPIEESEIYITRADKEGVINDLSNLAIKNNTNYVLEITREVNGGKLKDVFSTTIATPSLPSMVITTPVVTEEHTFTEDPRVRSVKVKTDTPFNITNYTVKEHTATTWKYQQGGTVKEFTTSDPEEMYQYEFSLGKNLELMDIRYATTIAVSCTYHTHDGLKSAPGVVYITPPPDPYPIPKHNDMVYPTLVVVSKTADSITVKSSHPSEIMANKISYKLRSAFVTPAFKRLQGKPLPKGLNYVNGGSGDDYLENILVNVSSNIDNTVTFNHLIPGNSVTVDVTYYFPSGVTEGGTPYTGSYTYTTAVSETLEGGDIEIDYTPEVKFAGIGEASNRFIDWVEIHDDLRTIAVGSSYEIRKATSDGQYDPNGELIGTYNVTGTEYYSYTKVTLPEFDAYYTLTGYLKLANGVRTKKGIAIHKTDPFKPADYEPQILTSYGTTRTPIKVSNGGTLPDKATRADGPSYVCNLVMPEVTLPFVKRIVIDDRVKSYLQEDPYPITILEGDEIKKAKNYSFWCPYYTWYYQKDGQEVAVNWVCPNPRVKIIWYNDTETNRNFW